MALRYSQGMAKELIGGNSTVGELSLGDFALVSGGASPDTITRTIGDFTAKFRVGDNLRVLGAINSADNIESIIREVAAQTITLVPGVFATGQTSGSPLCLVAPAGGSLPDMFNGGTLNIYSGTRPATGSDDIGAASLLLTFSAVQFGAATWDDIKKMAYVEATNLSAVVAASGQAAWFRLTASGDNATGFSTTAKRLDGTVGINTGDIQMKSVSLNIGETVTISSWKIYTPTGV